MADIELVIKINEDDVHRIVSGFTNEDDAVLFANLLNNGTLLPKGHGRLIDADELEKGKILLGTSNYCEYLVVTMANIKDAQTIIEADKAESEYTR